MKKENIILEGRSPIVTILTLAWPTILEQIMLTLVSYVDTAMVGSIGPTASAAVGINSSVSWLLNGLLTALSVGFSAIIARFIGAGDFSKAKHAIRQAITVCLMVSLFLSLVMLGLSPYIPQWLGAEPQVLPQAKAYLYIISASLMFRCLGVIVNSIIRCSGDMRTPMLVNIVVNVVNVIGNYLFIFETHEVSLLGGRFSRGLASGNLFTKTLAILDKPFTVWGAGMGVAGAALATSVSFVVGAALITFALFARDSNIRMSIKGDYSFDKTLLKDVFKIALPSAFERMVISSGQLAITVIVAGLGTYQLAAHYIAITAESISYLPAFGFSIAATTLIGQSLGAKRPDLAKSYARQIVILSVISMSFTAIALFFLAERLMMIFTTSPEVINYGMMCLKIIAFAQPFFAVSISVSGIFNGAGYTRYNLLVSLLSMWLVRILMSFIFVKLLGFELFAVWIVMCADFFCRSVLFVGRLITGKWTKVKLNVETSEAQ